MITEMRFSASSLAVGWIFLSATALAQDRLPAPPLQELFGTEVVYPQDRGELQTTFGYSFERSEAARTVDLPVGIEYGLTDSWQIGIDWLAFSRLSSPGAPGVSGIGGVAIGTKYGVMNVRGAGVHAAFGIDLTFSREMQADGGTRTGHELEPYLALAADLAGGRAQVFGSAGLSLTSGTDQAVVSGAPRARDEDTRLAWNTGALVAFGRLTLATEINVQHDRLHWSGRDLYVTPSITVRLPRAWHIGIGAPAGLAAVSGTHAVIVHAIHEQ
jgi:hypothetical protein